MQGIIYKAFYIRKGTSTMKKHIMKSTALLFSMALLALPWTGLSRRQAAPDAFKSTPAAYSAVICENPMSDNWTTIGRS